MCGTVVRRSLSTGSRPRGGGEPGRRQVEVLDVGQAAEGAEQLLAAHHLAAGEGGDDLAEAVPFDLLGRGLGDEARPGGGERVGEAGDRKSTRLNSSHVAL